MDQAILKNLFNIELEMVKLTAETLKGVVPDLRMNAENTLVDMVTVSESPDSSDSSSENQNTSSDGSESRTSTTLPDDYGLSRVIHTKNEAKSLEKLMYEGKDGSLDKNHDLISSLDEALSQVNTVTTTGVVAASPQTLVNTDFAPEMLFEAEDEESQDDASQEFDDEESQDDLCEDESDDVGVREVNPGYHRDLVTKI